MAINVVKSSIALSTVTYIQPKADVSFIEADVSLTYIEPEVKLSYIEVQVTAEVTMPDVLSVDIVTPSDNTTLSFTKSITTDVLSFSDGITGFGIVKGLDDSFSAPDTLIIGDIQPHQGAADYLANYPEDVRTSFTKSLADSISFIDVIDAVRLFQREFADAATVPDSQAVSVVPAPTTDSTGATDSSNLATDKQVSEGLTLIDNMDGDIEYAIIKSVSEFISNLDSSTIAFGSNTSDNVTTSSSGVLSMQDYSDITYFLEDYVGTSRTFT